MTFTRLGRQDRGRAGYWRPTGERRQARSLGQAAATHFLLGLLAAVGLSCHDSGTGGASGDGTGSGGVPGAGCTPGSAGAVGSIGGPGQTLSLLAGSLGGPGSVDATGAMARFQAPIALATDGAGNLFVADEGSGTIRRVEIATGVVTTLAGSPGAPGGTDGTGAAASFDTPASLASDGAGNLFVADAYNHTIRKVEIATGVVTTLAGSPGAPGRTDGTGGAAQFNEPDGLATDGAGNLFVADSSNHTIRKVVIATGVVTTLAGSPGAPGGTNGTGAAARFYGPAGLATDGAGNLFVADYGNETVRKVVIATGVVTTLAGATGARGSTNGTGAAARFNDPFGLATDGAGNLFVADGGNYTIREVVIATGEVTTLAGSQGALGATDGTGAAARFDAPNGLATDGAGNLFVADLLNNAIRSVVIATGAVTTLAGFPGAPGSADGIGAAASFNYPGGLATDCAGNLFVAERANNTIRKVVIATGAVTTLAGSPGDPGTTDGTGAAARLSFPVGLATDGAGNLLVGEVGSYTIRKVRIATGVVTTLAGSPGLPGSADGTGAAARFNYPGGLATDGAGNLFVGDNRNHTIRQVVIATGVVTTLAGSAGAPGSTDGTGTAARFNDPDGLAFDGTGNLLVADLNTIRKIVVATGVVTTPVGQTGESSVVVLGPLPASLNWPNSLLVGPTGALFITDENAVLVVQ